MWTNNLETDVTAEETDDLRYCVVMNHEQQYSIWPEYTALPNGWQAVGTVGGKQQCLDYIKEVWTDMRPLSLRQAMAAAETVGNAA